MPFAFVLTLCLPASLAAQSIVTASATPSPFTSGATIAIDASLTATAGPESWCFEADMCHILGGEPFLEVYGPNGFYEWTTWEWWAQWTDTGPGQTMQPGTYTVNGGVTWGVCWGAFWCEEYYSYVESGSAQASITPAVTPTVDSVTPASGTGGIQPFTLQYSSTAGYANIVEAWVLMHSTTAGANSCVVTYTPGGGGLLWLWDDAGTGWPNAVIGSGTILENSQCRVLTGGALAVGNGNTLTLTLPVVFKPPYAGAKNVFLQAAGPGGAYTGWIDRGNWTVPPHSITADSVSPSTGGGLIQTFAASVTSSFGPGDLDQAWLWFSPASTGNAANSCQVVYTRSTHTLALLNDAGTDWTAAAVGTGPGLQNSQCAVNTLAAGASPSGNMWTVNVPITFASPLTGVKNMYLNAVSEAGPSSGWQDRGDWGASCSYSVTPSSQTVGAAAGSLILSVTTTAGCPWTAPASSGFLTLSGGGGTAGSGSATYSFGSHTGDPRSTQLTVAGAAVSVMQSGSVPGATEQVLYYHTDAIGSVRVLTDANGQIYPNVQTRYDYLPYGVLWLEPLHKDQRLFTGQERDSETRLDYFGARHYASATGRFTSPDPLTLTAERVFRPDRLNRYEYANNNPLVFTDPTGLQSEPCFTEECAQLRREAFEFYFWLFQVHAQQMVTVLQEVASEVGATLSRVPRPNANCVAGVANVGAAVGGVGGAYLGAAGGGGLGGVGGSFVVPVVGTLGGGALGGAAGFVEGAAIGTLAGGVIGGAVGTITCTIRAAGGAGGSDDIERKTAGEIISRFKKGSIMDEFPRQYLNSTLADIRAIARRGDAVARKALKLLTSNRFNKSAKA